MCRAKEVLRNRHDLTTITDGNGTIVSVGVVVDGFLVILETLHDRQEVWPPFM